jgi:hypothetical protein
METPRTLTKYTGSKEWIISEEISMNMETKPKTQMPAGRARKEFRVLAEKPRWLAGRSFIELDESARYRCRPAGAGASVASRFGLLARSSTDLRWIRAMHGIWRGF